MIGRRSSVKSLYRCPELRFISWLIKPQVYYRRSHMRTLAKNLLVLSALAVVVIYFAHIFPRMQKGVDFADFYAAARIVRDGRGRELYDPAVQNQYLIRYSGRVGTYFIHPPSKRSSIFPSRPTGGRNVKHLLRLLTMPKAHRPTFSRLRRNIIRCPGTPRFAVLLH